MTVQPVPAARPVVAYLTVADGPADGSGLLLPDFYLPQGPQLLTFATTIHVAAGTIVSWSLDWDRSGIGWTIGDVIPAGGSVASTDTSDWGDGAVDVDVAGGLTISGATLSVTGTDTAAAVTATVSIISERLGVAPALS